MIYTETTLLIILTILIISYFVFAFFILKKVTKIKVTKEDIVEPIIILSDADKKIIKFCKSNLDSNKTFIECLKPLFIEIYGWNPDQDNNYQDYLNCIFRKLLYIYDKIDKYPKIDEIFTDTFNFDKNEDTKLPIEAAITSLFYKIRFNQVTNNDNSKRYDLN